VEGVFFVKPMIPHMVDPKKQKIAPKQKVYRGFNLYGEMWVVTHNTVGNLNIFNGRYFHLCHFKTGCEAGECWDTSKEAMTNGKKLLLKNGRVKVLKIVNKFVKKHGVLNKLRDKPAAKIPTTTK